MGQGHGADTEVKDWDSIEEDGAKLGLTHAGGAGSSSREAAEGAGDAQTTPWAETTRGEDGK